MIRSIRKAGTLLLAFGAFITCAPAFAQVATAYSFAQSTGTYTPITGGTLLVNQTTTTTSNAGSLDDGTTYTVPIPFTFTFDGVGYTSCTVTNNGSLSFGGTPIAATVYAPLSTTSTYAGAIAAAGRDLQGGYVFSGTRTSGSTVIAIAGGANTAGVTVGSIISGTGIPAGATVVAFDATTVTMSAAATATSTNTACWVWNGQMRYEEVTPGVFVIQWSNMKKFGTTLTTVNSLRMNFQVRLYQSDNRIEVIYGDCSSGVGTTETGIFQVGLRGPNNTFATNVNNRQSVKPTSDWGTSIAGTTNAQGHLLNAAAPANVIPSGLTYRWALPSPTTSYTPLGNTCITGARTLSANITDSDGIPTAGIGLPVLYWRINAGAYTPATGTFISGSQYDFSFGAGAVAGDVVSYYIVAQDNLGNVNGAPAGGTGYTANPPAATTPTGTPSSYAIGFTLSGNYNVGAGEPAPFNTITGAVGRYNTGCLAGAVTFTLIDATYPSETFPITITNNTQASATNTLTLKAGTTTTVTGSNATAIFLLNGADYVTIDGSTSATANTVCPLSAASRNLTISNTNTGTASSVVWIASVTGNAATNNTVRNCILNGQGTATTNVVIGAGGATVGSGPTAGPDNTSIVNNQISTGVFGVFLGGVSAAAKTQNTVINQNTLSTFQIGGIAAPFQNNITVSGNSVTGITNATSQDAIGINVGYGVTGGVSTTVTGLADGVSNATITNNVVGTVTQTNTFSAVGIALGNSLTGTSLIANNTVSGVGANSTSGDVAIGIYFGGGTAAANIIHNTVEMKGTFTGGSMPSYALGMHNSTVTTNVLNNILVNSQNNGATLARAIGLGYALPATTLNMNYNDLFVSGASSAIGQTTLMNVGTSHTTLVNWQTNSGKDANSKNVAPVFISGTDLHLDAGNASNLTNLYNAGTTTSVTTDMDCVTRAATPTIGADELVLPACSGLPSAGTSSTTTPSFCAGLTASLSNNASNLNSGIVYQWQVGPVGGPYADVVGGTGANTQSYTSAAMSAGTYEFVLRVRCTNEIIPNGDSFSNAVTVTVNPTPTSVPTSNSPVCAGQTLNLFGGTDFGTTFAWTGPNGFVDANQNPSIPSATTSASGTYNLVVTGGGCSSAPAPVSVTVNPTPATPVITPASAVACPNDPVVLTASPAPGQIFNQSGAALTIPTSGATGLSTPYPATAVVSGLPTSAVTVTKVTITGTHTWNNDMDVLLQSPSGQNVIIMSDCGNDTNGEDFTGTYNFVDGGALMVNTGGNVAGTYACTNLGGGGGAIAGVDQWPAPGPGTSPVASTLLSSFGGNMNGTWNLYVVDDTSIDGGSITAWSIEFTYANVTYTWSPGTGLNMTSGTTVTSTASSFEQYTVTADFAGCSASNTVDVGRACNDDCADAIAVGCNSVTNGTTLGTTIDAVPTCDTPLNTAGGVWYTVVGTGGSISVALCGSGYDTKVGVFTTPDCTTFTCVEGNNNDTDPNGLNQCGNALHSSLSFASTLGTTYYILVTGNGTSTGNFTMEVTCQGDGDCNDNGVVVDITTDNFGSETSWEIVPVGNSIPVCSGSSYPSNASISVDCCLLDGCYTLSFFDSFNDGMCCVNGNGGYKLSTSDGKRIIDNVADGEFTSVSSVANGFCLPIGNIQLTIATCDKEDFLINDVVVSGVDPAVSAQYGVTDATSGYQFWLFDPDGSYSRRLFRSHASGTCVGTPTGPTRAAHMKFSCLNSSLPNVPLDLLLNMRVRPRVAGVYGEFGPACRVMVLSAPPACPTTQLDNNPLHAGTTLSCGVTGKVVGASGNTGKLFPNIVAGANKYQYEFVQAGEGYTRTIATATGSYALTLANWITNPLLCGTYTYDVRVRVSFDGGANWCPYGPVCTVGITNNPPNYCTTTVGGGGGNLNVAAVDAEGMLMWPNPTGDGRVTIELNGLSADAMTANVEVFDLFGKRVATQAISTDGAVQLNTVMALDNLATGMYMVHVTSGNKQFTDRLVIK